MASDGATIFREVGKFFVREKRSLKDMVNTVHALFDRFYRGA